MAQEFHIIYQQDAMEVSGQGSSQTMPAENSAGSRATAERVTAERAPAAREMSSRVIDGIRIELIERGSGRPLLFLHPGIGIGASAPVLDLLAERTRLIAPSHPGFGGSEQPPSFTSIDDLAYFYLDLMDDLDLDGTIVAGVSLGGWIAAEMAVKSCARISHLVLANPVGIKVGGRETRDIADIFAMTEEQFAEMAYFDPGAGKHDYKAMPEAEVRAVARNREATARYGWSPYMHDPKLKQRLHRIRVPTLLIWGMADRILAPPYGQAYCAAIPGARLEPIARAGHFPHLESPEEFARRIFAFVDETT
jgi:pimeloyl-ACP methyl ester carboxylesterase